MRLQYFTVMICCDRHDDGCRFDVKMFIICLYGGKAYVYRGEYMWWVIYGYQYCVEQ